jgi:hypothetical protein
VIANESREIFSAKMDFQTTAGLFPRPVHWITDIATNIMKKSHFRFRWLLLLAAAAFALTAGPASAAPGDVAGATPLFGGYWRAFLDHWGGVLQQQNGIIMVALGLGAVSLFIITRGKWKK